MQPTDVHNTECEKGMDRENCPLDLITAVSASSFSMTTINSLVYPSTPSDISEEGSHGYMALHRLSAKGGAMTGLEGVRSSNGENTQSLDRGGGEKQ